MLRKSQDRVKRFVPGGFGSGRSILFAVLGFLVLWLVFGGIFYRVQPDEVRVQNEAQADANDILPRAHGEAEKMIQEAEAYTEQIVNRAQGEAQRFLEVDESYKVAKDIATQRVYLETLQEVFHGMDKAIIDQSAANGSRVVPYLLFPEIRPRLQGKPRREEVESTGIPGADDRSEPGSNAGRQMKDRRIERRSS